ncbi:hypothetical protein, partial [Kluyvera sichuanensis]|uniref:hypothetical protein n=1 Tax=Kluyvera sichuanensis TaxID=2725494 RepID=UPI001CC69DE0
SQPEDVSFDSSSRCKNLRDSNTPQSVLITENKVQCAVSIFSLIQIFKEQISQTSPEGKF